jgi:hypothetical protein
VKALALLLASTVAVSGATTITPGTVNEFHVNAGANLSAVSRAAPAGTTVIVHPGTYYNCSNLLKAGVNWYGMPGATLTFTNTTNNGPGWGIFDDRFSGAVTSVISGSFNLLWCGGLPGTNELGAPCCYPTNVLAAVVNTNPATKLSMEFGIINYISLGISHAAIWSKNGNGAFFRGREIRDLLNATNFFVGLDFESEPVYEQSQGIGFYWESGETYLNAGIVNGRVYSIYAQANADAHSNFWITCDHAIGSYYIDGTSAPADWRTWADIKVLETQTNSAGTGTWTILGGGKNYLRVLKIQSPILQAVNIGGGENWLTCQKISSATRYINLSGGTLHATVDDYETLGIIEPILVSSATMEMKYPNRKTNVTALVSGRYTNDAIGLLDWMTGIPNAAASPAGRTNLLPSAVNYPMRTITVFDAGKTAAGTNVWIATVSSQKIAMGPTQTNITANGGSLTLQSDGANWQIIGSWP